MRNGALTSGKLAKVTGLGVETLRFYEKEGLLQPAARTPAGYRIYDERAVERIHFVRRAQALGFTLREIRELIALDAVPDAECGDVRERAVDKLRVVERKIADLERMRVALAGLIDSCSGGLLLRDCPVMKCLEA